MNDDPIVVKRLEEIKKRAEKEIKDEKVIGKTAEQILEKNNELLT